MQGQAPLTKMGFEKRKAIKDEWYTPEEAIFPILKYLKKNSTIWCPFDTEESNFFKILQNEGHIVIATHIEKDGGDFFSEDVKNCDYIVSNPPFSLRQNILKRLFDIGKPFMMLMNTNGIFDSKTRWNLFKNNNFTLIYLEGRINYMDRYGGTNCLSPPFQSAYVCSKISETQIIFEEPTKNGGTNFTLLSQSANAESLISVKRESADSPNSPQSDNKKLEEANFS